MSTFTMAQWKELLRAFGGVLVFTTTVLGVAGWVSVREVAETRAEAILEDKIEELDRLEGRLKDSIRQRHLELDQLDQKIVDVQDRADEMLIEARGSTAQVEELTSAARRDVARLEELSLAAQNEFNGLQNQAAAVEEISQGVQDSATLADAVAASDGFAELVTTRVLSEVEQRGYLTEIRYTRGPASGFLPGPRTETTHNLNLSAVDNICFITGVRGQLDGGGERAILLIEGGQWKLRARSHRGDLAVGVDCIARR